jgi:hypothetical protein
MAALLSLLIRFGLIDFAELFVAMPGRSCVFGSLDETSAKEAEAQAKRTGVTSDIALKNDDLL